MMFRDCSILTSLAAAVSLALTAPVAAQSGDSRSVEGIAALVNDAPITTVDVRNRMRFIIATIGVQPTPEALERIQAQAIRTLIDETLQIQEAAEYEVTVEPAEIDEAICDLAARNNVPCNQITEQLTQAGVDLSTLRHQLEADIAWQILVGGRYGQRIRISNQQIETQLERIAESASQAQYNLAEILIEIPTTADEGEAQRRANEVINALRQGAPFQQVAQQYSNATSAAAGGEIGWVTGSQLRPEVAQVADILQPGQLSRPIRVPGGFMIIALIDKRDGTTTLQFDLTQVTLPSRVVTDESVRQLERALDRINSCEDVDAEIAGIDGAFSTALGEINADALLPNIRQALDPLGNGEHSALLETSVGRQAFIVCSRSIGGPGVPSREDIEQQLRGQQLSNLSRRWLRDLRRDSTVEVR
ncbi:peptidylprolyl isomerase [Hyphobacterium marinum]|uniref:Parvulin-like PPIase n=1 Tax=Hyphobacterium marinum TaxID=3116574 RepID=A0ABU7M1B3_9PROT|nr:peptidylprolyl isomerase [Hyphobacterium sp. Y6023]MEE2567190.1 peptidylprolyl isomerase [Hyphobacterium sp. Y6023]